MLIQKKSIPSTPLTGSTPLEVRRQRRLPIQRGRIGLLTGFTLIELLVVIAIIGVLSALIMASLNSTRKKSRDTVRISNINQLRVALDLYFDAQKKYPDATNPATTCTDTLSTGLEVLQTNGYIPRIPKDPNKSPDCYFYSTPPAPATTYHLGASLEDSSTPVLNSDRDCNSGIVGNCVPGFPVYNYPFDGTVSATYDIIP